MAKKSKAYELEIQIAGAVAKSLGTSVDKVEKHFDRIKKAGELTGKAVLTSGKIMGAGLAAAAAGAVALGTQSVKSAVSVEKAMGDIAAGADLSAEKLAEYENVLKSIYADNYGESFEEIGEKIKLVNQQMGELSDKDMQKVVESGYLLQDTFDIDFSESLRGADALMDKFGISAETAYNLIAQGAQNGLNQNGDLADQLAEYSVYYSNLGFSAEEMMNMISAGAKDGAFQIDYLNDALKEFGIRAIDNSDSTKDAFKALGLNAGKTMSAFAKGGETSKAAFKEVTTALAGVNNAVKRNEIGVALFGTKWEDLGESAVLAMANTTGAINASKDALSEMESVKYSDLSSMFEGLTRSVEIALLPLGEALMPIIGGIMNELSPVITNLLDAVDLSMLGTLAETVLPVVSDVLKDISLALGKILPPLLSAVSFLVQKLLPILGDLVSDVLPKIVPLIDPLLQIIITLVSGVLPAIVPLIDPILQIIMALMPLITALMPIVTSIVNRISDVLQTVMTFLIPIIDIISFLLTVIAEFETVIYQVSETVSGVITNVIVNLVGFVGGKIEQLINFIIRGINWVIGKLNSISIGPLPQWDILGEYAGAEIGFSIPEIPELALAEGGIAMNPVNALIGEGGEPEVVAPLSKLPTLLSDEYLNNASKTKGGNGEIIYYITYAPVINCKGGDEERISEIMDDEREKFKSWLDEYVHDNDRVKF